MAGGIYETLSSWTVPLVLFIALIALLAFCGMFAGKNKTVSE